MSAAIGDTPQKRCEELSTFGQTIGKGAALLRAAATTLRADESNADIKLRKIARGLVDEARLLLKKDPDSINSSPHPDALEIEVDLYRLYSQVLVVSATLASDKAIDGDGTCICPESDALELAAEFAGSHNDEGLYGRIEALARDTLVAGLRSSKRGTEARP